MSQISDQAAHASKHSFRKVAKGVGSCNVQSEDIHSPHPQRMAVAGVYAYLSELFGPWDQRPMFKANVDRLNVLRSVEPAVSIEKLKTLAGLFPTATYELQLDPSYEPTEQPKHPEHEADFKVLQECRAAKLVEPIDEDHLYYVAMNSKGCRLTALGRHYWRLVSQGRL